MKWTHLSFMSAGENGAIAVKDGDGWLALPDGGNGGAIGIFTDRNDAMVALEQAHGARLCCAEGDDQSTGTGEKHPPGPPTVTPDTPTVTPDAPTFTLDDVEVIDREEAFRGYFALDRYHLRHKLFAGGWSAPIRREIFERGHAAAVLLFDPGRDVLVFVEQFRPGAYAALQAPDPSGSRSPWLMECVAGIIEDGENPEDVVRREAFEEAHCRIDALIPIARYFVSPGGSSETVSLYCARTRAPEDGSLHGLADEHEDIRVRCLDVPTALHWLDQGRFNNALSLIAMQWFRLNRASLNARWT